VTDRQLVGPVSESSLPYEDLDILELYEHSKRVRPIIDLISTMFNDLSVFNR
jgi:UDP-glucose:glycoprotein glucosyltransferase